MLIFGVPKVNLHSEIKNKLQQFGKLRSFTCVSNEMAERSDQERFIYYIQV